MRALEERDFIRHLRCCENMYNQIHGL